MKQFTIVLDGIADRPQKKLEGKTPMEAAETPGLDALFAASKPGTVLTIKPGLEIGSSVANLSLLGYDAAKVYRGRAVIEAAGAGIPVNREDLYIRCNFVTLEGNSFETSVMQSYSAHDIETGKAAPLTERLNREVFHAPFRLIHIDTFRNILVVESAAALAEKLDFMPAHEMIGGKVADYIKSPEKDVRLFGVAIKGEDVKQEYFDLMRKAYEVLSENNDTKANGIWFWGASYAPKFEGAAEGKRVVLAETSLMRGIAALSGTKCVTTEEDKGFIEFLKYKAENAIAAVRENDYSYIHIQKLDDISHECQPVEKAKAIEQIDEYFIRPFFDNIKEPYSAIIVSDHYTFSDSGGHGGEPAPFMLLGQGAGNNKGRFTEQCCRDSGLSITAAKLVKIQRGQEI